MKTPISLRVDLFTSADALARRMGMTCGGLIAAALADFVAKHRSAKISERLDAVYAVEESVLDPAIVRAQLDGLGRSEW